MAPRRRPKRKNTRMDAALEAMKSYGFPNDLILKKIKELLKVYGDENWLFIEENSYRVLLDCILEQVEQEEHDRDDTLAGPSRGAFALPSSEPEALGIALPTSDVLKLAPQTYEALDTSLLTHKSVDNDNYLLLPGEGAGQKDCNSNQNIRIERNSYVVETTDKNCSVVGSTRNTNLSSQCPVHPEKPIDSIPIRHRRPFYGWISDDEVNEEDFVELEPAPLPDELAKLPFGTNVRRRRRTRWDLRPEDV